MVLSILSIPPWRLVELREQLNDKQNKRKNRPRVVVKSPDSVVDTQSRVFVVEIQLELMSRIAVGAYLLVDLNKRNMLEKKL